MDRVNIIKSYKCDLALSINWLTILKEPICLAFKYGIWNAHLGDLPKYRGNACPNWAILNHEEHVALSIHQIEPDSLDSGDILKKIFFKLDANTYITDIYNWLGQCLPKVFLETVDNFKNNTLITKKQSVDKNNILRCYPRKPEDSQIKWEDSANNVHALIRASSHPFSGAYCYLENGDKLFIWRADLHEHYGRFNAIPGQVLSIKTNHPIIACGKGIIKLTEFSLETKFFNTDKYIFKSLRERLL